jgi:phospholipid/cholesterol/gamma-HCH transport system permease protein
MRKGAGRIMATGNTVQPVKIPAPPARLETWLAGIGDFASFAAAAFAAALRPPWRGRLIFEQAWLLGLRAMPVAMTTALFVGMVIVLQAGYQLAAFNAKHYAAAGAAKALTQVMIPIFTALVVGARTAASIAAELGTMRVTEQIDALEILDVNPRRYLVVPRLLATTLMVPVLTLYGDLVGLLGGMAMGVMALQLSPRYYLTLTLQYLTYTDVMIGMIKTFFFGATMGLCGCYFGFNARGGAEGVGRATTRAVVVTLITLILLEYILSSWIIYVIDNVMTPSIG